MNMPRNPDPTRQEIDDFLTTHYPEDNRFEKEEAIYYFAEQNHSGQRSNLYSVLSTSPFKPGPLASFGRMRHSGDSDQACEYYDALMYHFLGIERRTIYAVFELTLEYNREKCLNTFNLPPETTDTELLNHLTNQIPDTFDMPHPNDCKVDSSRLEWWSNNEPRDTEQL